MWSKPLLWRFRQSKEIPQTQVSQGFAAFRLALFRIPPRHSQTRRDTNFAIPGYSIFAIIPRRRGKSKIFLSVVIHVVKTAFPPDLTEGENPAIAHVVRHSGLLSKSLMDRVYALPNQARYQLRYTRIFSFCHDTTSKKIIKVFPVRAHSYGQTRFCAALSSQPKSRKRRRRKAFRRFVLPSSGYCRGALKRSSLDRSAPDSENTPPACGRRIYYTSFFSGLQGKNGSPAHSPRAAFSASTRSVFSQATPRSSRPMWP